MTYKEIQDILRTRINAKPRGFQKSLVTKFNKQQGEVTQWFTGRRPIPNEILDEVAQTVGLTLTLMPIQKFHSETLPSEVKLASN